MGIIAVVRAYYIVKPMYNEYVDHEFCGTTNIFMPYHISDIILCYSELRSTYSEYTFLIYGGRVTEQDTCALLIRLQFLAY